MSLFKKRKNKNFRQARVLDEDLDIGTEEIQRGSESLQGHQDNENFSNGATNNSSSKDKKKKKCKNEKNSAILSFGDELEADDGIVFQEKKSSLSYRMRKEMKRERKEKERDEKFKNSNYNPTLADLSDLGIKIVNGREATAIAAQPGDSDEDEITPVFKAKAKKAEMTMRPWDNIIKKGEIPDANLIHEIRKQRQKAREDFIPVDDTVKFEDSKSRLIREDENDHSDDDDARIGFSVNHHEVDQKLRREVFDAAQDQDVDSEVDTDWELQQLKKAGATAKVSGGLVSDDYQDMNTIDSPVNSYQCNPPIYSSVEPSYGSTTSMIPVSSSYIPQVSNYQAETLLQRFKDSKESCNEVYRRHRQEADKVVDELISCKSTTVHCKQAMEPLTEKFQFYQDMRGYVTDLRECLNEKFYEIKKLEEQIGLQSRQRKHKLIQRRRQDVIDQNNEFSPLVAKQTKQDEHRVRRAAEREGRRTRRRREREKKCNDSHRDGISTDDEESYSDIQLRQADLDVLKADATKIFADVEDEFALMNHVMAYFEDWKHVDRPSYIDAFVSFNLPKIFEPYVRLELAFWNPLCNDDTMEVETMQWFNLAIGYDKLDTSLESLQDFKTDSDSKLMSYLIEKVVLPKLKELVSTSWDPMSHVQSVRLVNLIRHYVSTYPTITPNSKHLKELLLIITERIKDTVDNDVFIPMFPKSVTDSRTSGLNLFFQRQFWTAWKLMGSVLMWHNILSDQQIHDLAIRSLLNLYLVQALNFAARINLLDALDKTKNIISMLPREWCKTDGEAHVYLGRLEQFLLDLSQKMDPARNETELLLVCQHLKTMGATNQAKKLSDKYL